METTNGSGGERPKLVKILPFALRKIRQKNELIEESPKTTRIEEKRQNRLKRQMEDAEIDKIADDIIAEYASDKEITKKKNEKWSLIKSDADKDPDAVFAWLKVRARINEMPEIYLGLAEWWKDYRKPTNPPLTKL